MAVKCLVFGVSPVAFQDYFQMGYTTGQKCNIKICEIIYQNEEIQQNYLHMMNQSDTMSMHEKHYGVVETIGCLDCMHVGWKYCPVAWQGQFQGKETLPNVVLETYADYSLWIWRASFGYTGTLNDINIWEKSPLLSAFTDGIFTKEIDFEFSIGGTTFDTVWLLEDGICSEISRFAKTLAEAVGEERKIYLKWQEGCRKTVERAFRVLQRKFQVLRKDSEELFLNVISNIVIACIITHTMIVEHRKSEGVTESITFYLYDDNTDTNASIMDTTEETFERQEAGVQLAIQLERRYINSTNKNIACSLTKRRYIFYAGKSL
jgi:Plant transposon protein